MEKAKPNLTEPGKVVLADIQEAQKVLESIDNLGGDCCWDARALAAVARLVQVERHQAPK